MSDAKNELGKFILKWIEQDFLRQQAAYDQARLGGGRGDRPKRISYRELARITGLSVGAISKFVNSENPSPTVDSLDKLASGMGVDIHVLVEAERGRPVPEVGGVYEVARTVTQALRGRYQEQALSFLSFLLMEQESDNEDEALKPLNSQAK